MRRLARVSTWLVAAVVIASLIPASAGALGPILVVNTADGGPGSLRAAIELSNTSPGADTIVFAIPTSDPGFNGQWFAIRPLSALPPLTDDGTTIDGSTQAASTGDTNPAGPEIELNGSLTPPPASGFVIRSSGNEIHSLVINGFQREPPFTAGIGILISSPANTVTGCYIGIDPTGSAAVPNETAGIVIAPDAGLGNQIGGTAGARNVISGNGHWGVVVHIGADESVIQGNFVGTNAAGTAAVPNGTATPNVGEAGILVTSNGNSIGGTEAGAGNLISGNVRAGVFLLTPAAGNSVVGNYLGTDASGTAAVPNGSGVIDGGNNNTIGGSGVGARNVISGNSSAGIGGGSGRIEGNYIGTNAAGTAALPNGSDGVDLGGSGSLLVDNVISGNGGNGVYVHNNVGPVQVQRNLIGTDAAGSAALGNGGHGIRVDGDDALIGGQAGEGNVVSGNAGFGIFVTVGASGAVIKGNSVGTDAVGTAPVPNARSGVVLQGSGTRVRANAVAYNGGAGLAVIAGTGNAISRNSIFANGALGIELLPLGVNPNDPGDADGGANGGQNYPVLERAVAGGGRLVVVGSIDTPSPESITLEFFANGVPSPGGDPSGHGEGAVFLGAVTPNPAGRFTAVLPPVAEGTLITATATDAAGNTSEFAANVAARP